MGTPIDNGGGCSFGIGREVATGEIQTIEREEGHDGRILVRAEDIAY